MLSKKSNYIFELSDKVTRKSVSYNNRFGIKIAAEPKELYIVPDAGHVDLYDKMNLIPFDKLELFFTENLK
jgi:hypothetical protein